MLRTDPIRTACFECDLVVQVGELEGRARALCPRCGHVLTVHQPDGHTRSLAFALAAASLLVMANAFPFLALRASGIDHDMTLPQSALELYRDGYATIAVLVMGPIVVVPALLLAAIVSVLVPLRTGRSTPWLVPAGRIIFRLGPWSMVEVFLIGVLVSLVKIADLASVILGISFWAYVGFALCFTAMLASLDRLQLWREIEAVRG